MKLDKKVLKGIAIIAFIIILCTFLTRIMNSSETLSDYAKKNPHLAYSDTTESIDSTLEIDEQSSLPDTDVKNQSVPPNSEADIQPEDATKMETELFSDEYADNSQRYTLRNGFFYEPIPEFIQDKMNNVSHPLDATVTYDELQYLNVLYWDFNNEKQTGEIVCNKSIATDLLQIFSELYDNGYQFEQIALIDEYNGDDTLSMEHNNTSCFNYRVVDGTNRLSKHAYGLAIDINPFYNPYVTYENGTKKISPEGSEAYADRESDFPYKIDENDLCYKLFISHGFSWGGNWNSCKDYQHFQKDIE